MSARAVLVSAVPPATGGNGLAMRAGLFLEGMARGHEVSVVVVPLFGMPPSMDGFVTSLAERCVTLELAEDARTATTLLLSTPEGRLRAREVHPLPTLCRQLSPQGRAALESLTRDASLVHVMRSYLVPSVDFLLDAGDRPPLTLDLDELDSIVQGQLGEEEERRRFERLERYYLPRVDHGYMSSSDEAELVRRIHGAAVTVVPNAVHEPPPHSASLEHDLLFVGNLSYAPNVDAARWLCEEIRPHLGSAVTIALVGSNPSADVISLASLPGVTVAADVPEVTSWYARSRVAVAPLRMGGGTRNKIVEAQAHGRPVVATALGAAAVATGEDCGVIMADRAETFARTCRELLDDPGRAQRLGAAGRSCVVMAEQVITQIDQLTRAASRGAGAPE